MVGREAYNLDGADPRFITHVLVGPLDGATLVFGGNFWVLPYRNIRNGNLILAVLDDINSALLSDAEKAGYRGFVKTIQVVDFLTIINTHNDNGAVLDVTTGTDVLNEVGELRCKDAVFECC